MDEIKLLDERLKEKGLQRAKQQGYNFTEAVAKQGRLIGPIPLLPLNIHSEVVQYLRSNAIVQGVEWQNEISVSPDEYLKAIENPVSDVADSFLRQAIACALKISIEVIKPAENEKLEPEITQNPPVRITLGMADQKYYITDNILPQKKKNGSKRPSFPNDIPSTPTTSPDNGNAQSGSQEMDQSWEGKPGPITEIGAEQWVIDEDEEEEDLPPADWFIAPATRVLKYVSTLAFAGAVLLGSIVTKSTLLVLGNAYDQSYDKNPSSTCPYKENYGTKYFYYTKYMVMLILMSCLCFPEVLALVYSILRVVTKKKKDRKLLLGICLKGMVPEVLHAVGITFLTLMVIPRIDATLATVMLSLVTMGPAASNAVDKYFKHKRARIFHQNDRTLIHFVLSLIAVPLVVIAFGLLLWQIQYTGDNDVSTTTAAAFISLIFISTRYWENFWPTPPNRTRPSSATSVTGDRQRAQMDKHRFEMTIVYTLVRMATIVAVSFIIHFSVEDNKSVVETNRGSDISFNDAKVSGKCTSLITAFWMAGLTNALTSFGTYFFGLIACQTEVQIWAFNIPLGLATPVMGALTTAYTIAGKEKEKSLMDFFGLPLKPAYVDEYIGWKTMYGEADQVAIVVVVGFLTGCLALMFITSYLWKQKSYPMERSEILFVKPIYAGPLISEEMLLNRRQVKTTAIESKGGRYREFIPQLFLCATMWQENKQEMMQIMKSIMRLDEKQGKIKESKEQKDLFEFEVHVFFDNAFVRGKDQPVRPNEFVNQLLNVIPEAAGHVNKNHTKSIYPMALFETPYGGRIEILLPKNNLLYIHLKDSKKIRRKKRWSQCMYMHYILNYLPKTMKKNFKLKDVFILALDGDIDFQPEAVICLIDKMKRDPHIGAACGRIHPVGSGPIVWFQKFEYAIGHWLQKSAEDVLGCVLCSPGCFSLFRGEPLVECLKTYINKPTEAAHKIQWDQGEDRWLCTLLIKKGMKIEYSAASDSYTFAPEDFKEFYNQRRRWGPSTLANIFDILNNSRRTVANNESITWPYIIYQAGLLVASLLGASTVILIVQGALQYVFHMSAWGSLLLAVIPVIVYVIVCYTTKADTQVVFAKVLTLAYALIMMAVLVGVIGQLTKSFLNPTSLFMMGMVSIFAFTGLIHPREASCLIHGLLYYISVPSAMIFLPIYSYCNMNNVSWGTREKAADQNAEGKGAAQTRYKFTVGNWCGFCAETYYSEDTAVPATESQPVEAAQESKLNLMKRRLTMVDLANRVVELQRIEKQRNAQEKRREQYERKKRTFMGSETRERQTVVESAASTSFEVEDLLVNTPVMKISKDEKQFWNVTIEGYLKPDSPEDEKKAKEKFEGDLAALKNNMSGAYLFINSLWLVLTFSLAQVINDVGITLTDKEGNESVLNPIAFLFLAFYLLILLIQFITMLIHRWDTFLYLMAKTGFWKDKTKVASSTDDSTSSQASENTDTGSTAVIEKKHGMEMENITETTARRRSSQRGSDAISQSQMSSDESIA